MSTKLHIVKEKPKDKNPYDQKAQAVRMLMKMTGLKDYQND
jgi:hypothetical protein